MINYYNLYYGILGLYYGILLSKNQSRVYRHYNINSNLSIFYIFVKLHFLLHIRTKPQKY